MSTSLALVPVSAPEDISPGSAGGRFSLHKRIFKFNSILNWGYLETADGNDPFGGFPPKFSLFHFLFYLHLAFSLLFVHSLLP